MARTKSSMKQNNSEKKDCPGNPILNPMVDPPVSSKMKSQAKLFSNFYSRVDGYMSTKVDNYNKLSLYHQVPGKHKKWKKKSLVETLLIEENMNFEIFVKRIQRKCPWLPKCIPRRDLRTIAHVADEIGWDKLLKDQQMVVDNGITRGHFKASASIPFSGSLKKFEPWRTNLINNTQFQSSNGLLILETAFAKIYSDYLAQIAIGGYQVKSAKELAEFTGFKKALFEENGRGCVALIGVNNSVMKSIFGKFNTMSVANQRELKKEVMTYWVENMNELTKSKVCQDFHNIFPSLFRQISKIQKKKDSKNS
jgi:hypothetical protein